MIYIIKYKYRTLFIQNRQRVMMKEWHRGTLNQMYRFTYIIDISTEFNV